MRNESTKWNYLVPFTRDTSDIEVNIKYKTDIIHGMYDMSANEYKGKSPLEAAKQRIEQEISGSKLGFNINPKLIDWENIKIVNTLYDDKIYHKQAESCGFKRLKTIGKERQTEIIRYGNKPIEKAQNLIYEVDNNLPHKNSTKRTDKPHTLQKKELRGYSKLNTHIS